MNELNRRIFFILGGHRSGTSYLAQALSFLGLELPDSIQPGAPDNPKGHFESLKITKFHDELLNKLNASWETFSSIPADWFSSADAENAIQELAEIVKREFPGTDPIVLKDPRLVLFLPLWEKFAASEGLDAFYIVPLRHPLAVAASLQKRNRIGVSRSCLIWMNYAFNAEKYTRTKQRSFIHFPDWSRDPGLTIEKIEHDLGTEFPNRNKQNLARIKNEFEQGLVHHAFDDHEGRDNAIGRLCLKAYEIFLELIKDPSNASTLSEIDEVKAQFEELSADYAEVVVDIEMKLRDSHKKEEEVVAQVALLQIRLNDAEGRATQLEQQLQDSQNGVSTLKQQLSGAESRAAQLEQQLSGAESRVAQLDQQLESARVSRSVLHREVDSLKAQNSSLVKEYDQLQQTYNKELFTVIRPLYRNIYKSSGLMLRKSLPASWVESIKNLTPHTNGVPKQLSYRPLNARKDNLSHDQFVAPKAASSADIFVLSIINWDFRYQRPQHIAKALSESGRRVFYVEMEMVDGRAGITRVDDNLYRARLSSRNTGHIQPYTGQPGQEQTREWVAAFYDLCNIVKATSFKQIIIQHPYWWQLTKHLSPEFEIVFDCMDDISGFSNTGQFLLDLEKEMLQKCDKLVVSSRYLFDKYKSYQLPTLVRNAADLTHFEQPAADELPPSFLELNVSDPKAANRVKIGYVGAIAEWFDTDLIREAALNEPDFEFHLCGAVSVQGPAQLAELENIHMYGEIPYSEVPGFLQTMDVLIIPFKILPIIQACDPVKFYEYSAMGKPTVTTALPELARASDLTFVASDQSEFRAQIRKAFNAGKIDEFRKQLQAYAVENTWKHRADQFRELLGEVPKVSIVVLSYGDPELTKAALHALYDGGVIYPNLEILVVDNGSPDDALEDIKNFAANYPDITVIENGENLGFAKGNNIGLEAATGDYVLLLNNDTVIAPGSVYAMVRHLERNPAIGVVGPLTNNIGNEAKLFVEYENMGQMKDIARQATTGYRGRFTPIRVAAYFAAMFRRPDLKKFGLLPEDYGRGMFEDDDHCATIKSKGYICALAEDAYVHHHLSATFSKLEVGEKEALFERNKVKFERKWGKWQPHKYRGERPRSSLPGGE